MPHAYISASTNRRRLDRAVRIAVIVPDARWTRITHRREPTREQIKTPERNLEP